MGTYNSAILTDAGQSLIANAISGGGVVQFTNVQTSSYAYPPGTNIPSLTELQDVQQTEAPFSAQVFNDTMIQVSSRFDNSAVSEAYLIQTIGIFAQLGSDPAVLFAVVQATTPDQMPASSAVSPSAFIYNVQITVQQASSITVTVNPAGTATVQDILDIQANYVPNSKIDNNLLGTDPTHVLASPQGAALEAKVQFKDGWTAYASDTSLEQAISENIITINQFVSGRIHGVNISGTPIPTNNDVYIEFVRIGEGSEGADWYRVILYDCNSSDVYTIVKVSGVWGNWAKMTNDLQQ